MAFLTRLARLAPKNRRPLACCGIALAMLAALAGVWLVEVRPCESKSLPARLNDSYEASTPVVEGSVCQEFVTDQPLNGLAFVFHLSGGQPAGALRLELYDAESGALLAGSTGRMEHLVEGQYAGFGLDAALPAGAAGRYRLTLTPAYENGARLSLGCSALPAWPNAPLTVDGQAQPGSLAILASTRAIGRFVSVFYWAVGLALTALVLAGYWLAAGRWPLHRRYAVLCAGLGLVFCLVLPPYAAPDEQFHINQAFSGATRLSTWLDWDGWRMSRVPLTVTYRRPADQDERIQRQDTTVFTWEAVAGQLFTRSPDPFGSHARYDEPQADLSGELYLFSTLGVFLGFVLGLGFVPTLFLGRLANLAAYTLLTSWAVKKAPVAKPVFLAAGLLPMSLHLAASFSRDSLLLGLSFLYTALCLDAAFGARAARAEPLARREWIPLVLTGLLLAPAKAVYLPLCGLCLMIPAARLGRRPHARQAAFLAGCVLVFALSGARYTIAGFFAQAIPTGQTAVEAAANGPGGEPGSLDSPDGQISAGQADPDSICFSAGYILAHPGLTVQLVLRSALHNADHYLKTLVGGKLSYYSLDLGWGWVLACYLLLACACRPGPGPDPDPAAARRAARARLLAGVLALGCCGLAVLGCISWTPTYYETIYGLQGRYFLPALPAALLALCPAGIWRASAAPDACPPAGAETTAAGGARLLAGFAAVNAGVLLNAMLAIMAR